MSSSGTSLESAGATPERWCWIIRTIRARRGCWRLGSSSCQRGIRGATDVVRVVDGGEPNVELGVGAWWTTLQEIAALLAPECQLQKRSHGDYRLGRGCDKSRGSTGGFRRASE
jgi:hypothetical protein